MTVGNSQVVLEAVARNRLSLECRHVYCGAKKHQQPNISSTRHTWSASTRWHFAFGSMLSQQRNPCTDSKSAQQCTTTGHPYLSSKLDPGLCSSLRRRRGTDRHTYARRRDQFRLGYASREMQPGKTETDKTV